MRCFRSTYRDRECKKCKTSKWYIEFKDHLRLMRRLPAFTDKRQSEALGRQIEKLVACKVSWEQPDAQLARWLECVPAGMRERFTKIGLIDASRAAAGKLLSEHIADFKQSLLDKGDSRKQAQQTASRVRFIVDDCGFLAWTDIAASRVQRSIARTREAKGWSKKTANGHLKAIQHFARWMVQNRRASESPLEHLKAEKVRKYVDEEHPRRAIEIDELRRLLQITKAGPMRYGMSGYGRYLLYRLACECGLRANELRSLKILSFDFNRLTVRVSAAYTKNKQEAVQQIRPDTAEELKQFLAGKMPNVKAFGGTYKRLTDKTHLLIKADLQAAGIPYVKDGQYFDFHSLRHQTGTLLAAAGVSPKTA